MSCMCIKLHYFPILTCAWFFVSFIVTFLIAVLGNHAYIFFPFISDTGTHPPESCIFGQALAVGSILLALTFYIRYRQVQLMLQSHEFSVAKKWNTIGLWCGFLAALGISVVGNFQETNVLLVHIIGATMAFGIGTIYICIQSGISIACKNVYIQNPKYGIGTKTLCLRIFLTICCVILFAANSVCLNIALNGFKGDNMPWWTEEDGAHEFKLAAAFSEWLLVSCFVLYVCTLMQDFKMIKFEGIHFTMKTGSAEQQPLRA